MPKVSHWNVFFPERNESIYRTESKESVPQPPKKENELVVYGTLLTPEKELAGWLSRERIEQYTVFSNTDSAALGQVRTRCTDGLRYEQAVKVYDPGKPCDEFEEPCSKELFEQFRRVSTNGILKVRYTFQVGYAPVPELMWELDIMTTKDGKPAVYCKVDLELPVAFDTTEKQLNLIRKLPPLPFKLSNRGIVFPGKRAPKATEYVKSITGDWNLK